MIGDRVIAGGERAADGRAGHDRVRTHTGSGRSARAGERDGTDSVAILEPCRRIFGPGKRDGLPVDLGEVSGGDVQWSFANLNRHLQAGGKIAGIVGGKTYGKSLPVPHSHDGSQRRGVSEGPVDPGTGTRIELGSAEPRSINDCGGRRPTQQ